MPEQPTPATTHQDLEPTSPWHGRVDPEDGDAGVRWHQAVSDWPEHADPDGRPGIALLGLASDRGVVRNQGRAGAAHGPRALRLSLANLAWHPRVPLLDAGDVRVDDDLETGQLQYAARLQRLLAHGHFVLGLGGGHEIGWGSYLGCRGLLDVQTPGARLGILNLDAHFDLRRPSPEGTSGTPFLQAAEHCRERGHEFHYTCLGVARAANTRALFERAEQLGADWLEDIDFTVEAAAERAERLIARVDALYVTCCLDVFPAANAPGVSAPSGIGIAPSAALALLRRIPALCREHSTRWLCADIAELCPRLDEGGRTARLAARIADELAGLAPTGAAPRIGTCGTSAHT